MLFLAILPSLHWQLQTEAGHAFGFEGRLDRLHHVGALAQLRPHLERYHLHGHPQTSLGEYVTGYVYTTERFASKKMHKF